MKVTGKGEYGEVISRYFQSSFPKVAVVSNDDLLEILTNILVGTKEYRYGPKPKIEDLYIIRQTISKAIEANVPIPVLTPWGGVKANFSGELDVAEVSAIKQLISVDTCVKQFFPPGLHIHIRIEDLGADWIYRTEDVAQQIENYSRDMVTLVNMLKGSSSIEAIRESLLMDRKEYFTLSEQYSELLETVIQVRRAYKDIDLETIPEFQKLKEKGWKGGIDEAQQEYYISRYKRLYPDLKEAAYDLMLSDYLGGSKARYDLKGRAEPDSSIGSYIQITFAHPIPGAPKGMFSNTLYYRTIPESHGRTHIAPWRASGYLEISDDSSVCKIVESGRKVPDLRKNYTELIDGPVVLAVRTNYRFSPYMAGMFPPTTLM